MKNVNPAHTVRIRVEMVKKYTHKMKFLREKYILYSLLQIIWNLLFFNIKTIICFIFSSFLSRNCNLTCPYFPGIPEWNLSQLFCSALPSWLLCQLRCLQTVNPHHHHLTKKKQETMKIKTLKINVIQLCGLQLKACVIMRGKMRPFAMNAFRESVILFTSKTHRPAIPLGVNLINILWATFAQED